MLCPWCQAGNDEKTSRCSSCGRELKALGPGSVIAGRYEILEPLGRGGMGLVFKARDRVLEDIVALKILRPDVVTPELAKRFRAEIRLARKITHRNVCRIHEYGEDGPWRYISMAFVEGIDLKRLLRLHGPLTAEEALDTSIGVAEALAAIHEEGIVHRDLKTPNIMKDTKGGVKVMDFGIAKPVESETSPGVTGMGMIVGTPEYMSPEQAQGQRVDYRSDLFSLGIVIYELFTGAVPFRADTPIATLMKVVSDPPPLDTPEAARIPDPVLPVLAKLLAKEPSARYQTAAEVVAALEEARAESGYGPRRVTPRSTTPIRTGAVPEATPAPALTPTPVPSRIATAVPVSVPGAGAATPVSGVGPVRVSLARPPGWLVGLVVLAILVATASVVALIVVARRLSVAPAQAPATLATPAATAPTTATPSPVPSPSATEPSASAGATGPVPTATPSPELTPAPRPSPRVRPTAPSSRAAPIPSAEVAQGLLRLIVIPWGDVTVDGTPLTSLRGTPLPAGPHTIRVVHPDYEPLQRRVTIKAGETVTLTVDLPEEAIRKKQ